MTVNDDLSRWEARYGADDYEPDPQPTAFLVDATRSLTPGAALCLAAGAGRNAVHLAAEGWRVTALDVSPAGLAWCKKLAAERGVAVDTVAADLTSWDPGESAWDLITMVSYYDPALFVSIRGATRPGGHFLFHTFAPRQVDLGWGPRSAEHLVRPDDVRTAFSAWTLQRFDHGVFSRPDGRDEAVVRMLAQRPTR